MAYDPTRLPLSIAKPPPRRRSRDAPRAARHRAILRLVENGEIGSQDELAAELAELGFPVTQPTISRDLRELGVVRIDGCYQHGEFALEDELDFGGGHYSASVANAVQMVETAGTNLVVIHSLTGTAQMVAVWLDQCGWPEVIGTIGGDDTCLVAVKDASQQRALLAKWDALLAAGRARRRRAARNQ